MLSLKRDKHAQIRLSRRVHAFGFSALHLFFLPNVNGLINSRRSVSFGWGMGEPLNVVCRGLEGTPRGGGGQEECDTVESWSRGEEPFLLVDRFEICLGRVLRWSRPINGPREKGSAPVTRIHSWVSEQFSSFFSFSSVQPLEFFPVSEIDPLHILKQHMEREERRGSRGGAVG